MLIIFPDFVRNKESKIYSNTRSVLCVSLQNELNVVINKDKNYKEMACQLSM